jgi:hypothetical protein
MTKVRKAKPDTIKTIRASMKACQKKGLKIKADSWGALTRRRNTSSPGTSDSVCALGALLVHKNGVCGYLCAAGRADGRRRGAGCVQLYR